VSEPAVYHRRRARRALARLGCLALALSLSPWAGAEEVEPSLWSRLRRIEGALRGGDADALRASLAREGKVRLEVEGFTSGACSYGPGQLEVLLRRLLAEQPTRAFSVSREDVTVSGSGTAFARARWTRRDTATGALVDQAVTLTLREEAGDWRVHELLASRR
jgi:hypothetical protein